MLWGYFASTGPGALVQVNSIMNSTKYQDIFAKNLVASARRLKLGRKWIFQQDHDPKHTSKSTKKCLINHKFNYLQLPSQCPDLNPIESLWFELTRAVQTRRRRISRVQEEWSKILPNVFHKHFRKRLSVLVLARGRLLEY